MRRHLSWSFSTLLLPLLAACASNPDGGCPRRGLDLSRRCKRLCVVGPATMGKKPLLPCTCSADCLCWEMSGHPSRPGDEEWGEAPFKRE